jgi:hypothetical protein
VVRDFECTSLRSGNKTAVWGIGKNANKLQKEDF